MRNAGADPRPREGVLPDPAAPGPLFDGTEKVVSIDSFHWYNREVYTP
jgi:hypothetical protein